jgi:hypothetical protein
LGTGKATETDQETTESDSKPTWKRPRTDLGGHV